MYDYLDFDYERSMIREKFLLEMHKKTTLKDIGEKLDEMVLSSKASMIEFWDHGKHTLEQPKSATKDLDQTSFDWFEHVADQFDATKPDWL